VADTEVFMTKGRHRDILVTVLNSAGAPQDLTGRTLNFRAKRNIADTDANAIIIKATGSGITHATQSGATLGQATIAIAAANTSTLPNHTVSLAAEVVLIDAAEPYAVVPDVPPVRFWLVVGPQVINVPA
jgi:hypothetical protein